MDTSENKKRVLELAWRNYEGQMISRRRVADRVGIVMGASIAGVGLMFRDIDKPAIQSPAAASALTAMLIAVVLAFAFACRAWNPSKSGIPGGTDRDSLWHYLVQCDDDASVATMLGDICKATDEEASETMRISGLLRACMISCGIALVASMVFKFVPVV